MANLRMLVPKAITNYIKNPSFEIDAETHWEGARGNENVLQSADPARFGNYSLQCDTDGIAIQEGVMYFDNGGVSGIQDVLTASGYVRGSGSIRIRLKDNGYGGGEWSSDPIALSVDRWQRIQVTGRSNGGNDVRVYFETYPTVKAITFYLDGAQLEIGEEATTYCDGDQPGCRWNGISHSESRSQRSGYTREGGRWISIAGPCRQDEDLYVTAIGGLGMPPIANNIQSWADAPGSYYQNTKILDRVVTLSFFAKNKDMRFKKEPKLAPLHLLRQQLIDIIKPDRTEGGEPFLFEYQDGDYPLYLRMRYEAGLEGEWDIRNRWVNSFPVRFLAVDPILYEDNKNISRLDTQESFSTSSSAQKNSWGRINGVWNPMNDPGSLSDAVRCWAVGPLGEIYAAGDFTNNGLTRIAKWDGDSWEALGSGLNGSVYAMAVAHNGDLYVTGSFTTAGGGAANRIARWNGTWIALSTGLNGDGYALCVASNGQVYVGGAFTTAGGTTVNRIARWDGTQFRTCGSPTGLNATVRALAKSLDGSTIYVGGDGSILSNARVCMLDTSTNLFLNNMAQGDISNVYALTVGLDGTVYAGGTDTPFVQYFTGHAGGGGEGGWHDMGEAGNDSVLSLATGIDGSIYAGGEFTEIGGVDARWVARWVGGVWLPLDIMISAHSGSGASGVYGIMQVPNGDLFLGSYVTPSVSVTLVPGITLVENSGTQSVNPKIYSPQFGSGILRYIENQTTGKRVYLNELVLNSQEILTIDFAQAKVIGSIRGDITAYAVLPGSDLRAFNLVPGENKVAAFTTNETGLRLYISYIPCHWSMDAVKTPEPL